MDYGLQLYSVRDIAAKDFDYALREVAKMGYDFVEFAGFYGYPADKIKGMLEKYGLAVSSTHTGWQELTGDFGALVDYHRFIGNKNIVIPGADLGTKEKLDAFIDVVNEYNPRLKAEGINLHYHNHAHEFHPNSDGLYIHRELEERTEVLFQIDTYWAFAAGLDPVQTIERLKNRIRIIHLKDGDGKSGAFALGEGVAPVEAVLERAVSLGFTIVVESEGLKPDGLSESRRCIEFLNSLE